MKNGAYYVADPRQGSDYRLPEVWDFERKGFTEFSAASDDLVVVQGNRVDWLKHSSPLDEILAAHPDTERFVIYRPWAPGTARRIAQFRAQFSTAEGEFVQVAVERAGEHFARRVLQLRRDVGDNVAGVWIVGAAPIGESVNLCLSDLDLVFEPAVLLAAAIARIVPVSFALDEGALSVLFCKLTPPLLSPLSRLLQRLSESNYSSGRTPELY